MYHCTLEDKPIVVISLDTEILTLMVRVFGSRLLDHDWFLQTKKNQFVNVSKILDYIGNAVAITLPAMFILTGCDTGSYFYRYSKTAILEQVLKQEVFAVELLSDLGEHTFLSETLKKICRDICLWYVCSNVCSNLLPLTVTKYAVNNILQLLYERPSTGILNASMKIKNSCQIPEKSI